MSFGELPGPAPGSCAKRPDGSHFVPTETVSAPDASGVVVYRFGAPLYFANANLFMEEVEKLLTQDPTPVRAFVLDAEAIADIDTTGAEVLHQVLKLFADRGSPLPWPGPTRNYRPCCSAIICCR